MKLTTAGIAGIAALSGVAIGAYSLVKQPDAPVEAESVKVILPMVKEDLTPNPKAEGSHSALLNDLAEPSKMGVSEKSGSKDPTPKLLANDLNQKYAQVKVGWTENQVRKLLGEPQVQYKGGFWNYVPNDKPSAVKSILFDTATKKVMQLNVPAG